MDNAPRRIKLHRSRGGGFLWSWWNAPKGGEEVVKGDVHYVLEAEADEVRRQRDLLLSAAKSVIEDGFETYSAAVDGEALVIEESTIAVLREAIATCERGGDE